MVVPTDNTTNGVQFLTGGNVTFHEVLERGVVDSAGFFANDTWLADLWGHRKSSTLKSQPEQKHLAAWRALFLPDTERASNGAGR